MLSGFENVEEASARLGVDPSTVRRWCRSGRLEAVKRDQWHIVAEARPSPVTVGELTRQSAPPFEYATAREAGAALGCSREMVCYYVRAGRIPGVRGEGWKGLYIPRDALECATV